VHVARFFAYHNAKYKAIAEELGLTSDGQGGERETSIFSHGRTLGGDPDGGRGTLTFRVGPRGATARAETRYFASDRVRSREPLDQHGISMASGARDATPALAPGFRWVGGNAVLTGFIRARG
jgi:hypothetical protein